MRWFTPIPYQTVTVVPSPAVGQKSLKNNADHEGFLFNCWLRNRCDSPVGNCWCEPPHTTYYHFIPDVGRRHWNPSWSFEPSVHATLLGLPLHRRYRPV